MSISLTCPNCGMALNVADGTDSSVLSCPKCGAALSDAAPASQEVTPTSCLRGLVNLALLVAGALAVWMLADMVIDRWVAPPPLPVQATVRDSAVGKGLVVQCHNETASKIAFTLRWRPASGGNGREVGIVLEPNESSELGWAEGFRFERGDVVEMAHEGYRSREMIID